MAQNLFILAETTRHSSGDNDVLPRRFFCGIAPAACSFSKDAIATFGNAGRPVYPLLLFTSPPRNADCPVCRRTISSSNRFRCLRHVRRIEWYQQQFLDLFEPGAIRTSGRTPSARVGDEVLQLVDQYINQRSWFDEWHTATCTPIDRRAGQ